MALVKCKACGNQISKNARTCPQCGHPNKKPTSKPAGCLALIVLVVLVWSIAQQSENGPEQATPGTDATTGNEGSKPDPVGEAYVICEVMKNTGLTTRCDVRGGGKTVDVRMDTTGGEARKICSGVANQVRDGVGAGLSSKQWKLRIFSPYSGDEPIAVCDF